MTSGAAASGNSAGTGARNILRLTAQQRATIAQLTTTDQHVRAHEAAHLAAAGPYAKGGASYTYTAGPDGQLYATGGEVSLDAAPDPSDPRKTIEKARTIEAAANAPVDPSSQDRRVAARAAQMEQTAEEQLQDQEAERKKDPSSAYELPDDAMTGQILSQIL